MSEPKGGTKISGALNWGHGKGDDAGICFAMVLVWMKKCITQTGNSRVNWDQSAQRIQAEALYKKYVQSAHLSAKLTGTKENYLASGKELYEANDLRFGENADKTDKKSIFSGTVQAVLDAIVDKKQDDKAVDKEKFRAYHVSCAQHATGVFVWANPQPNDKVFYYFDPNCGVYQYDTDGFDANVGDYYTKTYCVKEFVNAHAWAYRVRPPK